MADPFIPGADLEVESSNPPILVSFPGDRDGALGIGPQGEKPVTYPGAAIVYPLAGMSTPLGRTRTELEITSVRAVVAGDPGVSITISLYYGPRDSGTVFVDAAIVTNQSAGQMLTTVNGPVPGGSYIWAVVDAIDGGGASELTLTLED